MDPSCKNCLYYSRKKCQLYNAFIADPANTTCLKFQEKRRTRGLPILLTIVAITVISLLVWL